MDLIGSSYLAQVQEGEGPVVLFRLFGLDVTPVVFTSWLLMGVIILLAWGAGRNVRKVPRGLQNFMEAILELVLGFVGQVMDRERARQFLPLLGSFFIFILFSNYTGLLPAAGHAWGPLKWLAAPTSKWSVTAGLAVVTFLAVQVYGLRKNGIYHFKHLVDPPFLAPIMLPLGLIEEVVRPFSLSIRLFANIFAGETVLFALQKAVPVALPMFAIALELIFGFIQAFIFTILSAVYIANATMDHRHHGGQHGHEGEEHSTILREKLQDEPVPAHGREAIGH